MSATVADDITRAEILEALTHLAATSARMPAHWRDRKAALHEQMNDLLDLLELS